MNKILKHSQVLYWKVNYNSPGGPGIAGPFCSKLCETEVECVYESSGIYLQSKTH